jgi:hypothetical protein
MQVNQVTTKPEILQPPVVVTQSCTTPTPTPPEKW